MSASHHLDARTRSQLMWLLVAAHLLSAAAPAEAQSFKASVVGTVTDSSGGVLPGALVAIRDTATGEGREAPTGDDGTFSLLQLAPGRYDLTVSLDGFRTAIQTGVVLETDQARRLDVVLQVGDLTESITVEASTPVLTTQRSHKGEVITARQVEDLPLNGRGLHRAGAARAGRLPAPCRR